MGALADKNQTEALQSSDTLKGCSVGQQKKKNKQQTSISRRIFFLAVVEQQQRAL